MGNRKPFGNGQRLRPGHRWFPYLSAVLLLASKPLLAREFYFSPSTLEGGDVSAPVTDLSIFSNPKAQLPGTYLTHVKINQKAVDERQLAYLNGPDGSLEAQLTPSILRTWGVKIDDYPELAALPPETPIDHPLSHYIPAAKAQFDFSSQTLTLNLPQKAITTFSAGYIDPSRWDDGIPVMFSDYAFNVHENGGSDSQNSSSQYLSLRNGANLGGWRLRNYSGWNNSDGDNHWQTLATWIQHDIQRLKAQLVAGQSSTKGEVFDSIQFSGVNIASDENMLPTGERGFAPVIRGTATSNAAVTVKQNGYIIYQSNVPPGPFEISDIYATSSNGDMDVTVKEADGTEHTFTQPFSSVALMQRPDHLRFEATLGRYRADNGSGDSEPSFAQGSAIYGVNNRITAYAGATIAEDYTSAVVGLGLNMGKYGSVSTDVTEAHTLPDHSEAQEGQSWRVLYSTRLEATQTQFSLASYRYSTRGYYSFADANHLDHQNEEDDWSTRYNKRNRLQLNINQPVSSGSLYVNGYQQDYWDTSKKERSVTAGGSYQFKGFSYHMNLSLNDTGEGSSDRMISVGVSVPLSNWLTNSWASYDISNTKDGATSQNIGLSGQLLDDNRLSYTLQQSHSNQSPANSSNLSALWRTPYSNLSLGYYRSSEGSHQLSYGARGAIVAHPHGLTLSQPLGEQFAVVNADGASGIKFQNQYGIRTDWWGNAVIPSLSAYQENRIGLDTTTLPDDVDSSDTAVTVVPSRNAAVQAHFHARTGSRVLLTLTLPDGKPVPFGAMASTADNPNSGIVDEQGLLYLTGMTADTLLHVQWGNSPQERCQANVQLTDAPEESKTAIIKTLQALCQPERSP
ncbi:fimbria/pilus outer membrane usher protein [Citrobacter amalonaticus]|uniref:fimbria/pilus outer membrane usher protein n=1 Tax=Citrobacter amalonaticus TaxID=35703 RepID=UPI00255AE7F5|nr:fimbria/pilus outer membrane usher protein [Citrobacter amalonaticus]MDL4618947.1 fimbria/pilus outer membrane usher protein [Citrobacter amalonaticus]MDL4623045.1 fimbria/pilus outer membrane usher protein [Citrobacter amalonaticus]